MGTAGQPWLKSFKTCILMVVIWSIICYSVLWTYKYYMLSQYSTQKTDITDDSKNIFTKIKLLTEHSKSIREETDILKSNSSELEIIYNQTSIPPNEKPRRHVDLNVTIDALIKKSTHNFPLAFLNNQKGKSININKTCGNLPSFYEINFNNIYWQYLVTRNGTFYLYSSFYDRRREDINYIRIIGMINVIDPTVKTYCQLWYKGASSPIISTIIQYKYIWYKSWGNYKNGILQPYIMSCQVPEIKGNETPVAVSLVENICDTPSNILRITNEEEPPEGKRDFAVCVKAFDYLYEDISIRLIEWLEVLFTLGAHKVFLYVLEVHPNVLKVLQYYENLNKIDVIPLTLPGGQPNLPSIIHKYLNVKLTNKRQNEVIPYNDCYYRNIYNYNFVALMDVDEIIMPRVDISWKELMKSTREKYNTENIVSFCVRNVYFFDEKLKNKDCDDDIPCYLHFLRNTNRSIKYTKPYHYAKCFHSTDGVLALHNHYPISCLSDCKNFSFDTDVAHLQHYRKDCVAELMKICQSTFKDHLVEDKSILRFKDRLLNIIPNIVNELELD